MIANFAAPEEVPGATCRVPRASEPTHTAPGTKHAAPGTRHLALCAAAPWLLAAVLSAQAPITNAKVDMRSAAQGVDRVVQTVAATKMPAWIGYRLAAAPGARRTCGGYGPRVLLEPPSEFYVLARMEAGGIVRLRSFTPECDIDAGGLPLIWLTDLKPADGIAWLVQMARTAPDLNVKKAAVTALTRSSDPAATKFFDDLLNGK